jgi:hypothetical protein
MTEALASKTCTPCRGGIPPLTREQAELAHRLQTGNWRRKLTASSGVSGFAISGRRLPLFRRLVNSRKLKAIIRISASVGAMQRSRCRQRRSRDCMRTTSSWPPRLTAYSLGRPWRERVLVPATCAPFLVRRVSRPPQFTQRGVVVGSQPPPKSIGWSSPRTLSRTLTCSFGYLAFSAFPANESGRHVVGLCYLLAAT